MRNTIFCGKSQGKLLGHKGILKTSKDYFKQPCNSNAQSLLLKLNGAEQMPDSLMATVTSADLG